MPYNLRRRSGSSENKTNLSEAASDNEEISVEYRIKKLEDKKINMEKRFNGPRNFTSRIGGLSEKILKTESKSKEFVHVQKSQDVSSNDAPKTKRTLFNEGVTRMVRSRVMRRNTMDCAILNEMFVNEENKNSQNVPLDADRLLKKPLPTIPAIEQKPEVVRKKTWVERAIPARGVPKLVESCNRYMSVCSRPTGCRSSAPPSAFVPILRADGKITSGLNIRKEFHETFANLIKLGNVDRQEPKISHEDHTWQTELKDLIWLELQAWQADRTMEQQDKYLFTARQGVSELLDQIMNYKFQPRFVRELSELSIDSGISIGNASSPQCNDTCRGCISLYCQTCVSQQERALKEIEELLTRIEAAEALYPSSHAMGAFHPIYKSENFVGRIKAMCLWYNITKQNKLKLSILGKILAQLQGEKFSWPVKTSVTASESSCSSSSGLENDDSDTNSVDSATQFLSSCSAQKVHFAIKDLPNISEVDTEDNKLSNAGSDNSKETQAQFNHKTSRNDINIFSVEPLGGANEPNIQVSSHLYRKFIENVLKSRGLAKSLAFLQKMYTVVLYKVHISLEKPSSDDIEYDVDNIDDSVVGLEPGISSEQIEEIRRYGYWSVEARSLNLPSYIPTFVFLSGIPLQFMHEFLRMRLETRPAKPNPLSLEQLMKELREGLTLALTHRERYQQHITTALVDLEEEAEQYMGILDHYDATVRKVFELYLDYIDQLVLGATSENNQKSTLEKEWMFTKLISPMINGMHSIAANKFCNIIRNLLLSISERLLKRTEELDFQITDTTQNFENELKWQLLTICRETQALFTAERDRSVKLLFFAKNFCRDVETQDFHRDHYEADVVNQKKDFVCAEVKESFTHLQKDVLNVRSKLMNIICRVQERCAPEKTSEIEDQDRQAVLSRTREILHQGYKFAFDYNKDVLRLFEQSIMINKDDNCQVDLALGIINLAEMWMQFVTERCERGRGMRPRWASQGLEFLIIACDPQITRHLNDQQFDNLKKKMDGCISHVIGITSEPEKVARKKASPRSRKNSSPATSRSRTPTRPPPLSSNTSTPVTSPQYNKYLQPQFSLKEEVVAENSPDVITVDTPDFMQNSFHGATGELRLVVPQIINHSLSNGSENILALRQIRVRDSVNRLDMKIDEKLREKKLIGTIKSLNTNDKIQIRARSVNFNWHRGIKIGQGRFGKVYTAVNNNTGELMAMKEIAIQPGESRALKNVAEELKILEGIKHKHLVRYYGIEVHREELLIFMELCPEGTLESLVELSGGLPELLTKRFTEQLLRGVSELHKHGIVHRDIKTANIFLIDSSNSLKLGDFGSAVKIQAHTTVPGELQGYVGTQAYMAPEVFTKTNCDGHGRAADIWSVGCVVIEMASGKRPWFQFDSNFQIMFKVGMGERPAIPESLSMEGHDFLEHCLQHDPKLRKTANELLEHNFCKYGRDDDANCDLFQQRAQHSFRRNAKNK